MYQVEVRVLGKNHHQQSAHVGLHTAKSREVTSVYMQQHVNKESARRPLSQNDLGDSVGDWHNAG